MVTVKDIKLTTMIALTSIYFLVQFIASHLTHSLTLLASSYHMLYNIMSLLCCLISIKMSRSQSLRNTFGWARIEVLGTLGSILFLFALYFSILVEALQTMVHASHQDPMHHPILVLIIAVAGIVLNAICFCLLGGYTHEQGCFLLIQGKDVKVNLVLRQDASLRKQKLSKHKDNTESGKTRPRCHLLLDFFRDVFDCLMVICCACLVHFVGGDVALFSDPILSIISVFTILISSYPFVKQSGMILLQNVPENIDVALLKKQLLEKFPQVLNVHDLHIWRLARNKIIATSHIICMSPKDYKTIAYQLDEFFLQQGITLATIQPEFIQYDSGSPVQSTECVLGCGNEGTKCQANRCCAEIQKVQESDHLNVRHRVPAKTETEETNEQMETVEISEEPSSAVEQLDTVTISTINEQPITSVPTTINETETTTETNTD